MITAMLSRLTSTAMPPISNATSTRMAKWNVPITVRTRDASLVAGALWGAPNSGRQAYLEV